MDHDGSAPYFVRKIESFIESDLTIHPFAIVRKDAKIDMDALSRAEIALGDGVSRFRFFCGDRIIYDETSHFWDHYFRAGGNDLPVRGDALSAVGVKAR